MRLLLITVIVLLITYFLFFGATIEGWATSPGTLDQLAASSTEYPFWQFQYGYRYPQYRIVWPYYEQYPTYEQHAHWPKPYGFYTNL